LAIYVATLQGLQALGVAAAEHTFTSQPLTYLAR
jgi:hypothetical protein